MDTEIFRYLLDRHTRLAASCDAHDVITELSRVGLRHDAILPGQPSGLARSDVTYPCSRPEAFVFGQELASFWGDYESFELPEDESQEGWDAFFAKNQSEAKRAGKKANEEKMAGFYVDLDPSGEAVLSPADVSVGTIADDLQTAAQVVEMLLIKDHSRMKLEATTPYDSTHEQQHRLLPITHPEDWAAASQEFRDGGYIEGRED